MIYQNNSYFKNGVSLFGISLLVYSLFSYIIDLFLLDVIITIIIAIFLIILFNKKMFCKIKIENDASFILHYPLNIFGDKREYISPSEISSIIFNEYDYSNPPHCILNYNNKRLRFDCTNDIAKKSLYPFFKKRDITFLFSREMTLSTKYRDGSSFKL